VLLSTHILSEVVGRCARVVVIARGTLVASATMDELAKTRRAAGLRVIVRGNASLAIETLKKIDGIAKATEESSQEGDIHSIRCTWSKKNESIEKSTEDAVSALVAAGLHVREAAAVKSSLEELFAELTGAASDVAEDEA
jgi:ABC-2 type transport system ATP-binding protein